MDTPVRLNFRLEPIEEGIRVGQLGFTENMDACLLQQRGRYTAIGHFGVSEGAIEYESCPARWTAFFQYRNPDLHCTGSFQCLLHPVHEGSGRIPTIGVVNSGNARKHLQATTAKDSSRKSPWTCDLFRCLIAVPPAWLE